MQAQQTPLPGTTIVKYEGDILYIHLQVGKRKGTAFLRTNYDASRSMRREIINSVELGKLLQSRSWYDLPMERNKDEFSIALPLTEVGLFDFKACFVSDKGAREWVEGNNLRVKVEPALLWADNGIYNAFIRQFGPNKAGKFYNDDMRRTEEWMRSLGYSVQPPTGHFDDVFRQLGHIMEGLGFRIVMFLPVHPVTAFFSKMGRFGSPFAPLNFKNVDMTMADFDRRTTPVEQFCRLVDGIHARGGLALMDMPFDHTGWASSMQVSHPEWFCRNEDGTFESPGAWGVVWADLCKLDFSKKTLWKELADIALHWCRLGIDGFRCDAGYMVPLPVWRYITAKVREQFPDTVFLLEGLGGSLETTRALLEDGGLDWAYSESFQQYGYEAENGYLDYTLKSAEHNGVLVNFAETHDNSRLAAKSPEWARLRVATAALLAPAGAFGMANGVEWLATEKIDVHGDASLNWGAQQNIVGHIAAITRVLRSHPAFASGAELRRPDDVQGRCLALLRKAAGKTVLVLVNPDLGRNEWVSWKADDFNPGGKLRDLLTGREVELHVNGERASIEVCAGMALCLSRDEIFCQKDHFAAVQSQQIKAMALHILKHDLLTNYDVLPELSDAIAKGWDSFKVIYRKIGGKSALLGWNPRRDGHRSIFAAKDTLLVAWEECPFIVELYQGEKCLEHRRAVFTETGIWVAILTELQNCSWNDSKVELLLKAKVFRNVDSAAEICQGKVTLLEVEDGISVKLSKEAEDIEEGDLGLCANICGSYTMARASWGRLFSKYDGLLAVNFTEKYPDERWVMLSRMRAWLHWKDFSYELSLLEQSSFGVSYDNALRWKFRVQCGLGITACISAIWMLDLESNAGCMHFELEKVQGCSEDDHETMTLIVRPDVDCRSHHSVTKAYMGAEERFPACVQGGGNGLVFCPDTVHSLKLESNGIYHNEPEWIYNVALSVEQERGLDTGMDVFSPGYFAFKLKPGASASIKAVAYLGQGMPVKMRKRSVSFRETMPFEQALQESIRYFYVLRSSQRESHATIMAGFPWFLDWGRDTLICLRGFIAAGKLDMAKDVICQFAQFEEHGTLPNMIRGKDTSDRDTSDAPLWLFIVVDEYIKADHGRTDILQMDCGGRALKDILLQLAEALWNGAQNGVRADWGSGLLYSRAHFTWMDTNYPAGTPREGYPVEIQALWIAAMKILNTYTGNPVWKERYELARASFARLFIRQDGFGLVDCRHSKGFVPAEEAVADDAVRPNQIFAITLGIVDEEAVCDDILEVTAALLIPGGIRSLDDAPVAYPQPVTDNGRRLNDPRAPYWGHYSGDENSRRKPAYHNGTAWGWQMPMYCEAMMMRHPENAAMAKAWLASAATVMEGGCIGFIPEIYDGDAPHTRKGCPAQAWSMTEFLRVILL